MLLLKRLLQGKGLGELVRYGVIGLSLNALFYLTYLGLTWLGLDPKLVVTINYPVGLALSYSANKKFTFHHQGELGKSMGRFLLTHLMGYGLNVAMLHVLVDRYGYPHQLVQVAAIFVCAAFTFFLLKFFVFKPAANKPSVPSNG